jgi:hypothetical protein
MYLGDLLYKRDNTHDWIEREKVIRKLNAVYTLLDIDKNEQTFSDFAKQIIREV